MLQHSRVIKLLQSFKYYFIQYSTEAVSALSYKQQQLHSKITPLAILLVYINIINLCISHC